MSVSTKSKRKLVHQDKTYYWHVTPDYDRMDLRQNFNILHVIAEDKSLELHEPLELMQPVPETVTPCLVKNVIETALHETEKGEHS